MRREILKKSLWIMVASIGLAVVGQSCATSDAERDLAATSADQASCEVGANGKRGRTNCPGSPRQEGIFLRDRK
jgi:hypothetical protein